MLAFMKALLIFAEQKSDWYGSYTNMGSKVSGRRSNKTACVDGTLVICLGRALGRGRYTAQAGCTSSCPTISPLWSCISTFEDLRKSRWKGRVCKSRWDRTGKRS
jgi:hypothetical protein